MGFADWIANRNLKTFANGIFKSMVITAEMHRNYAVKKGVEVKLYSDLAVMALTDRPGWDLLEENIFVNKSGSRLKIEKDYSVADVSLLVVLFELEEHLKPNMISEDILELVVSEYKKMFKLPQDKINRIIKAWANSFRGSGGVLERLALISKYE